jgi:hypothetical protein
VSMNPNDTPPGGEYPPPPPPANMYSTSPSATGFDFQSLFRQWQTVLTKPSIATFDAQLPSANWNVIWIGLVILGVARAIFGFISAAETAGNTHTTGPGFGTIVGGFIGVFIGFFIIAGVLYLVAKLFSGTGTFLPYAYALSLFFVPLGVISAVAGIIPVLGALVAIAAGLYQIYLAILATASVHRLDMGKSTAVVLIPIAILVVIGFLLALAGLALLVAAGY